MERIMGRIGSYEFSDHIVATERMTDTLKSRVRPLSEPWTPIPAKVCPELSCGKESHQ